MEDQAARLDALERELAIKDYERVDTQSPPIDLAELLAAFLASYPPDFDVPPKVAPWERWPGESAKHYDAFCRFRDMGPTRSVNALVGRRNKSVVHASVSFELAKRHQWRARAEYYDRWIEYMTRHTRERAVHDATRRHIAIAQMIQDRGLEALEELPLEAMSAAVVLRFLLEGMKAEASALGITHTVREERRAAVNVTNVQVNAQSARSSASSPTTIEAPFTAHSLQLMLQREQLLQPTPDDALRLMPVDPHNELPQLPAPGPSVKPPTNPYVDAAIKLGILTDTELLNVTPPKEVNDGEED